MNYPEEWDNLPRRERKKKLKALKRQRKKNNQTLKKSLNWGITIITVLIIGFGYIQLNKKSPEKIEFEKQVANISLTGKIEEFPIEGRSHVSANTAVTYQTNPPTSGSHLAEAKGWGIYNQEISDKAALHSLEHGGIWISYKDLSKDEIKLLKKIGKQNPQSTIISPRSRNDDKIVIAS